jgi:hypothetical protein
MAIAAAASIPWVILCARAERTGEHQGAPLAVFGIALAALILLSGLASDVGAWSRGGRRGSTCPVSAVSARIGC